MSREEKVIVHNKAKSILHTFKLGNAELKRIAWFSAYRYILTLQTKT